MDKITFTIPGKPEYLTMVRLAISAIATNMGFDIDATEDIKTAVAEACKNVSCHGSEGFSDKYEVDCNVEKKQLEIIVRDDCDCHTIKKDHKPCKKCPEEGNIGVFVIQTLMNEVEFGRTAEGRKEIRMVKNL